MPSFQRATLLHAAHYLQLLYQQNQSYLRGGSADDFKQVFPAIESRLRSSGLEPGVVANQYPRELGSMARLYRDNPDYYNSSPDMLLTLSHDAMASGIEKALVGRPT